MGDMKTCAEIEDYVCKVINAVIRIKDRQGKPPRAILLPTDAYERIFLGYSGDRTIQYVQVWPHACSGPIYVK